MVQNLNKSGGFLRGLVNLEDEYKMIILNIRIFSQFLQIKVSYVFMKFH